MPVNITEQEMTIANFESYEYMKGGGLAKIRSSE